MSDTRAVTQLLQDVSGGRREAIDRLVPVVYDELRRIALAQLRGERDGHTLSATAVVHEAYLKLVDIRSVQWRDRAHFFAVAARQMRRILIDHARTRGRTKRGGGQINVSLDEAAGVPAGDAEQLIMLDDALSRLEELNERQCRVVECRCFVGLSVEETAEALGASPTTIKRDWAFARAWLNKELRIEGDPAAGPDRDEGG
jgi:RNA polymerase sigma factor (TIGR02999 family)